VPNGNVAIALPPDERAATAVLRRGRRLASQLGVGWVAIFVAKSGRTAASMRDLVATLGGELIAREARDVAAAVVDLSRRQGVRWLVIGSSRRPRLLRRIITGTTEQILRAPRPFDVVIAREGAEP
jgi:K+-sensing histidine kinase KdpD